MSSVSPVSMGQPIAAPAPAENKNTYTVNSGDNLWSIVREASPGLSNADIAKRVNQIIKDNPKHADAINNKTLQVGAKLDISAAFGNEAPVATENPLTGVQVPVTNMTQAPMVPVDSAISQLTMQNQQNPATNAFLQQVLGLNNLGTPNNFNTINTQSSFTDLLINGGDPRFATDFGLGNRTFGGIANNLSGVGLIPAFDPNVILNNVFG